MNNTSRGWMLFIGSMGAMCTLLAFDLRQFKTWNQALQPESLGLILLHIGTLLGAFAGGKIIPEDRERTKRTRSTDVVILPKDIKEARQELKDKE